MRKLFNKKSKRRRKKTKPSFFEKVKESPINYFSDLFIVAMVVFWIVDNIYEGIIATIVTMSSVVISLQSGTMNFDTSMWSSIGTNVAIPLASGGAIWMIKNGVQHAIANNKGKSPVEDFPEVGAAPNEDLNCERPFEPNVNAFEPDCTDDINISDVNNSAV